MATTTKNKTISNVAVSEIALELSKRFVALLGRHQVELWSSLAIAELTYIIVKQVF